MAAALRVGVMGAGAIGCYVGGRLAQVPEVDVVLVGRSRLRHTVRTNGLRLTDLDGRVHAVAPDALRYESEVSELRGCDIVLCCVKSGHTDEVATAMADVLDDDPIVVSMQNGVRNTEVLRAHLTSCLVLPGVVGFNVVDKGDGDFRHTTKGALMIERCREPRAERLFEALRRSDFELATPGRMAPHQWTKLIVNLNNAVSALSGAPTRDLILNAGYRAVVAAVMGEGAEVVRAAGHDMARLRGLFVPWLPRLLGLPTPLVRLLSRAQLKADPEARSSMWQDLSRGRLTEVEFLNGEIVRVAAEADVAAPINTRIVEMIHDVELRGSGSPNLEPEALQQALGMVPMV
jgi:2-dehydropantoate 2-reductase